MARSKVKSRSLHNVAHLQPSLPSINFLHLTVSEIWPGQDFIVKVTMAKVKSRSHHDIAHLHALTDVLTKYQFPTPYRFKRYSPDTILQIKVNAARSQQGQNMMLHTYTP